jgi:peroxiredoxin
MGWEKGEKATLSLPSGIRVYYVSYSVKKNFHKFRSYRKGHSMSLHHALPRFTAAFFLLVALSLPASAPLSAQEKAGDTLIGKAAPELILKDQSGKDFRLSALKGKVVLLEFWATWCPDCKEVLPSVQELFTKYTAKGLAVVLISVDVKTDAVKPFLEEKGYTFPVLLADRKAEDLKKTFQAKRIPTAWLIDRKGIVRAGYVEYGKKGAPEVEAQIVKLIGE